MRLVETSFFCVVSPLPLETVGDAARRLKEMSDPHTSTLMVVTSTTKV